jgi:hypothetical protein
LEGSHDDDDDDGSSFRGDDEARAVARARDAVNLATLPAADADDDWVLSWWRRN